MRVNLLYCPTLSLFFFTREIPILQLKRLGRQPIIIIIIIIIILIIINNNNNNTNKWYIHNPAPVLENDAHKLIWDFDIHTDHLILGQKTRPYNNQQKKKENLQNCRLCYPGCPQNKIERMLKER